MYIHPERRDSVFIVTNTAFTNVGSSAEDDTTTTTPPPAERMYDIVDVDPATSALGRVGGHVQDSSRVSASNHTHDSADIREDALARMGGYVGHQGSSTAA